MNNVAIFKDGPDILQIFITKITLLPTMAKHILPYFGNL